MTRHESGQRAAVRIVTLPGVFRPISESWLLAEALEDQRPGPDARVLDLCTGSGVLAVTAARCGARTTAIDVSRRAVAGTRLNARLNGTRVRALRGSLFGPVAGERFDFIVCNPPYVPSVRGVLPRRGVARGWEGGRTGRVVLDRFCGEVARHLRPGGTVLITHSALIGERRTHELLERHGLRAKTVKRVSEPLGPIMTKRLRQGVLPGGTVADTVLVIEARA